MADIALSNTDSNANFDDTDLLPVFPAGETTAPTMQTIKQIVEGVERGIQVPKILGSSDFIDNTTTPGFYRWENAPSGALDGDGALLVLEHGREGNDIQIEFKGDGTQIRWRSTVLSGGNWTWSAWADIYPAAGSADENATLTNPTTIDDTSHASLDDVTTLGWYRWGNNRPSGTQAGDGALLVTRIGSGDVGLAQIEFESDGGARVRAKDSATGTWSSWSDITGGTTGTTAGSVSDPTVLNGSNDLDDVFTPGYYAWGVAPANAAGVNGSALVFIVSLGNPTGDADRRVYQWEFKSDGGIRSRVLSSAGTWSDWSNLTSAGALDINDLPTLNPLANGDWIAASDTSDDNALKKVTPTGIVLAGGLNKSDAGRDPLGTDKLIIGATGTSRNSVTTTVQKILDLANNQAFSINGLTATKSTLANDDEFAIADSADGDANKKILWSDIKTQLPMAGGGGSSGVLDATGGLPTASSGHYGSEIAVDGTGHLWVCSRSYSRSSEPVGTFTDITRSNTTNYYGVNDAHPSTTTAGAFYWNTQHRTFYKLTRAGSRSYWLATFPSSVLAGTTIVWLGIQNSKEDALLNISTYDASTTYYYFDRGRSKVRKLTNSTFTAAGTPVAHYTWERIGAIHTADLPRAAANHDGIITAEQFRSFQAAGHDLFEYAASDALFLGSAAPQREVSITISDELQNERDNHDHRLHAALTVRAKVQQGAGTTANGRIALLNQNDETLVSKDIALTLTATDYHVAADLGDATQIKLRLNWTQGDPIDPISEKLQIESVPLVLAQQATSLEMATGTETAIRSMSPHNVFEAIQASGSSGTNTGEIATYGSLEVHLPVFYIGSTAPSVSGVAAPSFDGVRWDLGDDLTDVPLLPDSSTDRIWMAQARASRASTSASWGTAALVGSFIEIPTTNTPDTSVVAPAPGYSADGTSFHATKTGSDRFMRIWDAQAEAYAILILGQAIHSLSNVDNVWDILVDMNLSPAGQANIAVLANRGFDMGDYSAFSFSVDWNTSREGFTAIVPADRFRYGAGFQAADAITFATSSTQGDFDTLALDDKTWHFFIDELWKGRVGVNFQGTLQSNSGGRFNVKFVTASDETERIRKIIAFNFHSMSGAYKFRMHGLRK